MWKTVQLVDTHPDTMGWYSDVLTGLQKPHKTLPAKLFYDERGSQLFDAITALPEYYPTRTEQAILDARIGEIAALLGDDVLLVEYGSGSSRKTRTLLDHIPHLAGYVPIDISRDHLQQTAKHLALAYPHLEILPVVADYEADFKLPTPTRPVSKSVAYYPGSTIGNFHPLEAIQFLKRMRQVCGNECGLLIGVDLKKDPERLHDAYNDSAGVTAAFNLNMLDRLNRELGANFNLYAFRHVAFYNEKDGRIEMHLQSMTAQTVRVNGLTVHFKAGECIWTESSYKYTIPEFAHLAAQAGFQPVQAWTDEDQLFSVQYFATGAQ